MLGALLLGFVFIFVRKPNTEATPIQVLAAVPGQRQLIIAPTLVDPAPVVAPVKADFALAARLASVSSINTKAGRKPYRAAAPRAAAKPQPKPVRVAAKKPKTIAGPVVLGRMRMQRAAA